MPSPIQRAVERAIEGGYNVGPVEVDMICDNKYDHHLLSPLFWQSLGKAEGWGNSGINASSISKGTEPVPMWRLHWHRFIDHLAEGKSPEEFFEKLLQTKD